MTSKPYTVHPATDKEKAWGKTISHTVRFNGDHKWPEDIHHSDHGKHGSLIGFIKTDRHGFHNGHAGGSLYKHRDIDVVAQKMQRDSIRVVRVSDLKPKPRAVKEQLLTFNEFSRRPVTEETIREAHVYKHSDGGEYLISHSHSMKDAGAEHAIHIGTGQRIKLSAAGRYSRKNFTKVREASQHDLRHA